MVLTAQKNVHIVVTDEEKEHYIVNLKRLINANRYIVSNRPKNIEFIEDYRIDSVKEKEIFNSLCKDDLKYKVQNKRENIDETLYVFIKTLELDNWGTLEIVNMYIKTNITENRLGREIVVVVSFHN